VGQEFKLVTERIRIGRSMDDALQETADRLAWPSSTSSASPSPSSVKRAATWPKRWPTWPMCCASARR
jgi:hypothetical protein